MELRNFKESPRQKFVFVISQHPHLGVILEPYVVDLTQTNEFSLTFRRVTVQTITDYGQVLFDEELELLTLMEDFLDENIIKQYSKEIVKPQAFFSNLSEKTLKEVIRPNIEERLDKCLKLLYRHNLKLHFKGIKKDPIQDKPIEFTRDKAEVIFNFIKESEKTRYFISVQHHENDIKLTGKHAILLTDKPCWLFLENKIYNFTGEIDGKKLVPFFTKAFIEIPPKSEKMYFETFILKSIKSLNVRASGFNIREENPEGKALLKLERTWNNQPALILCFQYNERTFLAHEKTSNSVSLKTTEGDYSFFKIERNKPWEKEKKEYLESIGLINTEGSLFSIPDGEEDHETYEEKKYQLISWLNGHQEKIKAEGIDILQENTDEKYYTGQIRLDYKIELKNDWFDLYATVIFDQFEVPFSKLKNHILTGRREFQLPNGLIAIIPEEWFSKYKGIMRFGKEMERRMLIKRHHFSLIESLDETIENSEQFKRFKKLRDIKNIKLLPPPDTLNATLRPYQAEGYSWLNFLHKNKLGGCLADDMGLGKTIQVLTQLLKVKKEQAAVPEPVVSAPSPHVQLSLFDNLDIDDRPKSTSLIVMPLSLVHNWENEIKKFTPELKAYKHVGINRNQDVNLFKKYDVVLTTYGVIRNDVEMFRQMKFHYIILDESQVIKNPDSKIFKAIKELISDHKIVMTGTPIENSLTDLWSQLTFINDGMLGSYNFFKKYFVNPIEKFRDEQKQNELKKIIEPFILRRTKQNVAKDLPPVSIQVYYSEMSDTQKRIYEEQKSAIRNHILDNLEKHGREKSNFVILNGLMKLRLLANHPSLVEEEKTYDSGKFEDVIKNIEKLIQNNHKVLVFSSFVKHLELFSNYFSQNNIKYNMLTGDVVDKKRKTIIDDFQNNEETMVFLISIKAGGVGLNLTSADYVFILDPWWNPAVENQAINRTHRIGQDKAIFAYKFISRDSIEEKILKLQEEKQMLSNEFINDQNLYKHFSDDEIRMLLN